MARRIMTLMKPIARQAFSPKYLLYTNAALGVGFMGAADTIQQKFEEIIAGEKIPLDLNRTKSMMGGGLFFGAVGHYWYAFLDKRFPGKSGKTVLKKLGCEIPAGPPLGLAFFVVVGALQGKPIDKTWSQFKENLVWLCLADWIFYVPLQAFNFLYLAPKYRFLYVACLNLVYDTFLSFILHRPDGESHNAQSETSPVQTEKAHSVKSSKES